MNQLTMKNAYKTFYSSQRACSNIRGVDAYIGYHDVVGLIGDAFTSDNEENALRVLFFATQAANIACMDKRSPDFTQSKKLAAALAKFRGVAL